jgi:glucoamylase
LSGDNWQTVTDTNSSSTALGIEFLDIAIDHNQTSPIHFTFFWTISQNWENRNYQVAVVS